MKLIAEQFQEVFRYASENGCGDVAEFLEEQIAKCCDDSIRLGAKPGFRVWDDVEVHELAQRAYWADYYARAKREHFKQLM